MGEVVSADHDLARGADDQLIEFCLYRRGDDLFLENNIAFRAYFDYCSPRFLALANQIEVAVNGRSHLLDMECAVGKLGNEERLSTFVETHHAAAFVVFRRECHMKVLSGTAQYVQPDANFARGGNIIVYHASRG